MAQFARIGNGGYLCHKDDKNDKRQEAILYRALMPHSAIKSGNVYGINDIERMMANPAFDTSKWPPVPAVSVQASAGKDQRIAYYDSMMDRMISDYMSNAIEKNHMKSYEKIVKGYPLFDLTKAFMNDDLEKYSDQDTSLNPEEFDHIKDYGWEAFIPCLNTMTVRVNMQRYYHIDLLELDSVNHTIVAGITDYSGNRRNWTREISCIVKLDFKTEENTLGIDTAMMYTSGYEEFLINYMDEMGWTKQQRTLWTDAFDIHPLDGAVMVDMMPMDAILEDLELPDEAKQPIKFILWDKKLVPYLSYANLMKTEVDYENSRAVQLYTAYLFTRHKTKFLQLMSLINFELSCTPGSALLLSEAAPAKQKVGRMAVTSPHPLNLRMPHTKKITTKET